MPDYECEVEKLQEIMNAVFEEARRWRNHERSTYVRALDFSKEWIDVEELKALKEDAKKWRDYIAGHPVNV